MQAGWFSKQEIATLQLRAPDILPLIECGRGWCGRGYGGLPVQVGHVSSSLRLIVVAHDNQQLVVLTKLQGYAFPTVDISYSNIASQVKVCGVSLARRWCFKLCFLAIMLGSLLVVVIRDLGG